MATFPKTSLLVSQAAKALRAKPLSTRLVQVTVTGPVYTQIGVVRFLPPQLAWRHLRALHVLLAYELKTQANKQRRAAYARAFRAYSNALAGALAQIMLTQSTAHRRMLGTICELAYRTRSIEGLESLFLSCMVSAARNSDFEAVDWGVQVADAAGPPKRLGGGVLTAPIVDATSCRTVYLDSAAFQQCFDAIRGNDLDSVVGMFGGSSSAGGFGGVPGFSSGLSDAASGASGDWASGCANTLEIAAGVGAIIGGVIGAFVAGPGGAIVGLKEGATLGGFFGVAAGIGACGAQLVPVNVSEGPVVEDGNEEGPAVDDGTGQGENSGGGTVAAGGPTGGGDVEGGGQGGDQGGGGDQSGDQGGGDEGGGGGGTGTALVSEGGDGDGGGPGVPLSIKPSVGRNRTSEDDMEGLPGVTSQQSPTTLVSGPGLNANVVLVGPGAFFTGGIASFDEGGQPTRPGFVGGQSTGSGKLANAFSQYKPSFGATDPSDILAASAARTFAMSR